MPDLLVTGTDTGVGKTVIAAALVIALRAKGIRAIGFKPAETGLQDGEQSDADILARASAEQTPLAAPLLQLREPLAPAVAAERAGIAVSPQDIERRVEQMRREGFTLVVEGAGGIMVPLVWQPDVRLKPDATDEGAVRLKPEPTGATGPPTAYTILDLAERLNLEAIVVGRAGLGTLNHIALTVAMLRLRKIPVKAIVLNGRTASPDLAESINPLALPRMVPGLPIVEIPHRSVAALPAPARIAEVIALAVPVMTGLLQTSYEIQHSGSHH